MRKILFPIILILNTSFVIGQILTSEVKVAETNGLTTISGNVIAGKSESYWQGFKSNGLTGKWGFQQNDIMMLGLGGDLYNRGFSANAMGIFNALTTKEDVFLYNQNSPTADFIVLKASGKIGIGTTDPLYKLEIFEQNAQSAIRIHSAGAHQGALYFSNNVDPKTIALYRPPNSNDMRIWGTDGSDIVTFKNSGNVGIGTTNPSFPLHIKSSGYASHLAIETDINGQGDIQWFQGGTGTLNQRAALQINNSNGNFEGYVFDNSTWSLWLNVNRNNGYVGIGTSDPNYKLEVNGSIKGNTLHTNTQSWSDFVFENNYELRTLEEVEKHIQKYGHLPEIPSEAEVTENGFNLGEMDAKLLQKIEELTLYLIEQNKQNQNQQKQLAVQAALIEQLQNEVTALKNK